MLLSDRNYRDASARGWVHTHGATIVDMFRLLDVAWILVGLDEDRRSTSVLVRADISELITLAHNGEVDIIYISLPPSAEHRIKEIVTSLSDTHVTIYFAPDFSAPGQMSSRWETIGGMPIVNIVDTTHQGIDSGLKRMLDIIGASLLLLITILPMAIIALAIKSTSGDPAIFPQSRYGLGGEKIKYGNFAQ